jgi:predicted kinase
MRATIRETHRTMLIILAGLPGTGKTTLARRLCGRVEAFHLRIDTIEAALVRSGMLRGDVGPAGYGVAYAVAAENLRFGRIVVADSVNPLQVTREAWRAVAASASSPLVEVEIVRSDRDDHRRIAGARTGDIEGLVPPSWESIASRTYDPWDRPPVVIDTSFQTIDASLDALLAALANSGLRALARLRDPA